MRGWIWPLEEWAGSAMGRAKTYYSVRQTTSEESEIAIHMIAIWPPTMIQPGLVDGLINKLLMTMLTGPLRRHCEIAVAAHVKGNN